MLVKMANFPLHSLQLLQHVNSTFPFYKVERFRNRLEVQISHTGGDNDITQVPSLLASVHFCSKPNKWLGDHCFLQDFGPNSHRKDMELARLRGGQVRT